MKIKREQLQIDPSRCTACNECAIACATKHHGVADPKLSRIKILEFENGQLNVPVICMACEDPPCISVCPMNARIKTANGSVVTNTGVCIGCKACLYICPVASPVENPETGQTMTCDLCQGEPEGPRCVAACKDGALTMHAYTWLGDTIKRDLGLGDILGIQAIYGE